MKHEQVLIDAPAIFSWSAILGYLDRDKNEIAYRFWGRSIYRAFQINHRYYLVKIDYLQGTHQVRIKWLKPELKVPSRIKKFVKQFVFQWFDMGTNLKPFYQMARRDKILSRIIKPLKGLRLIRFPNFYESITWEILGQQINVALAYRLKHNFIEKFGHVISYENHRFWTFPKPKDVARSNVKTLFKLGLTHRKAEYILGISRLLANHQISRKSYLDLPDTKTMLKALEKLRGIGPWGANCICMRGLNRGNAIPASDIGLLNGIKSILKLNRKPTKKEVNNLQMKWGRWSAYATFYIWRYLY